MAKSQPTKRKVKRAARDSSGTRARQPDRPSKKRPAKRKRARSSRKPRRFRRLWVFTWLAAVLLVAGLVAFQIIDRKLNLIGNIVASRGLDHPNPLRIRDQDGRWVEVTSLDQATAVAALESMHDGPGLRVRRWRVSREPVDRRDRIINALVVQEVILIEMSPLDFTFETSFQPGFGETTATRQLVEEDANFSLTANFHDPEGRPLGWVVHDGREVNPRFPEWSGFFFVKNGRPWFGPRSLLDEIPGEVTEAFQVYPSLMRDHTVFSYVDLEPDRFFDGRRITHRSLGGVRLDGTLVFILSGRGGVMNVAEVARLARLIDIQHATLLDGGRALQYAIRDGRFNHRFHAFNKDWDWLPERLEPVRPPVFLTAKRIEPIPPPP